MTTADAPEVSGAPAVPEHLKPALIEALLAMADDELLLGHRDAEWTGLGPILEEDIAFSSMAQDEMGHALVWYDLAHGLGAPDADTLVYTRGPGEWRNARLFELPRGDYAFSLVRQYLADIAQAVIYDSLARSNHSGLAEAAVKLRQEEKYHLLHGRTLINRLALAAPDSRQRIQSAVTELMPYGLGIWEPTKGQEELVAVGILPDASTDLKARWLGAIVPFLMGCGLEVDARRDGDGLTALVEAVVGGRAGEHGPELGEVLEAMQTLRRADPEAVW